MRMISNSYENISNAYKLKNMLHINDEKLEF